MANLVPRNPLEGKGARVACAPSHASPGGPGLRSQVRWGLFGGRGECGPVGVLVVGCARELWSRQPCSGTGVVPRRRPPASPGTRRARPCAPFVSRVAGSPSSHGALRLCLDSSLCARHEDAACGARCAQPGSGLVLCAPGWGGLTGPGGRGAARERDPGPRWVLGGESEPRRFRVSPGGSLSCRPPPLPSPGLEQLPPCVLRGRERKGGKSYFSKLLSSRGGGGSPVTHVGAGREWLGRSDFPECRGTGAASGCPLSLALRLPECCPHPHPRPRRASGPDPPGPDAENPVWRPGRQGEGRSL